MYLILPLLFRVCAQQKARQALQSLADRSQTTSSDTAAATYYRNQQPPEAAMVC